MRDTLLSNYEKSVKIHSMCPRTNEQDFESHRLPLNFPFSVTLLLCKNLKTKLTYPVVAKLATIPVIILIAATSLESRLRASYVPGAITSSQFLILQGT